MVNRPSQATSIWKNTAFTKLLVAFGISSFGDWFDLLAVSNIMVYQWHVSPFVASLWGLSFSLPSVLFSQIAGVLADKFSQIAILRFADASRFVVTLTLLLAPNPWSMLGILTVRGTIAALSQPAQGALNRRMVEDDQLLSANGITNTVSQMSKIVGPVIGAAVMGMTSPHFCLLLNAVSFLVSFGVLLLVKGPSPSTPSTGSKASKTPFHHEWKQGWAVVLRNRVLFHATWILFVAVFTTQIADTMWAILLRSVRPLEPQLLGWVVSIVGLGALPCTIVLSQKRAIHSFRFVLGMGATLMGAGFLAFGLFRPDWPGTELFLAALVLGIGVGIFFPTHSFLVQKQTPPDVLGRVMGILNSLTSLAVVIGPLCGGVITERWGPSFTFTWSGWFTVVTGAMVLFVGRRLFVGTSTLDSGRASRAPNV